jgi:hypothetical protein
MHFPMTTTLSELATKAPTSGSHPGPPYYIAWAFGIALIVAAPLYLIRIMKRRKNRRGGSGPA